MCRPPGNEGQSKQTMLKRTYAEDQVHDRWESVYRQNPLESRRNDKIMDRIMIHTHPPPGAVFLDAGCGTGDHAIRIARRGFCCTGIDISQEVLRRAQLRVSECGLTSRINLVCGALEEAPFDNEVFDVVHCRGVLMHIPEWERALGHLCRILKPGGKIVIMENNHKSLEMKIVLLIRRLVSRVSRLARTPAGLEFWSEENGNPFLVRFANIRYLIEYLEKRQLRILKRFGTGVWDINRFPSGFVRNGVIRFNLVGFSLHFPSTICSGNAVVAEKEGSFGEETARIQRSLDSHQPSG
jgi:ubiquinone/menaquinone biosynthesis C-methylase UbiE